MPPIRSLVLWLVIINGLVFALQLLWPQTLNTWFALYFPENQLFHPWQLITHMFLHGNLSHLLFNMYGLWVFGTPMEKLWGSHKFLTFYLVAGIGAGIVHSLFNHYQFMDTFDQLLELGLRAEDINKMLIAGSVKTELLTEIGREELQSFFDIYYSSAVGASGAIYGVLVAFAMANPNAKLMLIFLPVAIPAKYFVPLLLLADFFFGVTKYSVGNVAHFAHIGGALSGLLVILFWQNKSKTEHKS